MGDLTVTDEAKNLNAMMTTVLNHDVTTQKPQVFKIRKEFLSQISLLIHSSII